MDEKSANKIEIIKRINSAGKFAKNRQKALSFCVYGACCMFQYSEKMRKWISLLPVRRKKNHFAFPLSFAFIEIDLLCKVLVIQLYSLMILSNFLSYSFFIHF